MKLNSKEFARKCCYFLEECKLFCLTPPVFELSECTRLPDGSMMKVTNFLVPDDSFHLSKCVDFISVHQVTCESWRTRYRQYLVFFDSLNEKQRYHWLHLLQDSGFQEYQVYKLYYSLLKSD